MINKKFKAGDRVEFKIGLEASNKYTMEALESFKSRFLRKLQPPYIVTKTLAFFVIVNSNKDVHTPNELLRLERNREVL